MDLDQVLVGVKKIRNKNAQTPCIDDCERAIGKLKILGNGFDIIELANKKLVQSIPTEVNKDHSLCLSLASDNGVSIYSYSYGYGYSYSFLGLVMFIVMVIIFVIVMFMVLI